MIATILVGSYLCGAVALLDQLRRPPSAWAAADRNRGWWISTTVALGIFACGLFVAAAYLIGVVLAFSNRSQTDASFRKL